MSSEISSTEVQAILDEYSITPKDLKIVSKVGKKVIPQISKHIEEFYVWLEKREEWPQYFTDPTKVIQLKALQGKYWEIFFKGEVDCKYIENRRFIGELHAKIGLSLPAYFAGLTRFFDIFASDISNADEFCAINRLSHMDAAVTVESYNYITNEKIAEQGKAIMEMSTPVTAIWEGVLMLPIVGILDSKRAQELMHNILMKINSTQAKVVILDISGVAVVDTAVANHIIKITKATKLMGCICTVSGVSPAIAQTIVELGIDVDSISTTASLKDALKFSFERVGVSISEIKK